MSQIETPRHDEEKHIFFSYAEKDDYDSRVAAKLKNNFNKRRFRIYYPREHEDINIKIAFGIENAAAVLVFPSPSLQISKRASKILNYADQTKTPILNIKHCEDFQPRDWLGAILASAKSCSTDYDEVMKTLISLGTKTNNLVLKRGEENEPHEMQKHLFHGGSRLGNVFATYNQYGQEFLMKLKFLGLEHGRVFGQGDDEVGAFTLAGKYNVENGYGKIKMYKQYVGKHSVKYRGKISFQGIDCLMEGKWRIHDMRDKFSIYLTLPEIYTTEIEKMPLPRASRRQGRKVMLSYCPNQYNLSQIIMKGLIAKGIPAICPPIDMHEMIKIATAEARVVVPLMSKAYEASNSAKYVLSYVDEAGIPIVPIKAQNPYSASGWLGVICAGALWTQMANANEFEQKLDELIGQLNPYISDSTDDEKSVDALADETLACGYYIQWGRKFDMKFDMFSMINGYIAGQGDDEVGGFVIHGKYNCLSDEKDFEFQFKKHYIGQYDVQYSGTSTHNESQFFFDGNWFVGNLSDRFHLQVSRKKPSEPNGLHVMISYQWNNQKLVKKVANMLKQRNIPIWFDIAGDMKGNINTAMANGVERASAIICFNTVAYSKSVNCQKELTYASQLKKNIVPVLLEDHKTFESTWLGMLIAPLNKINMQDDHQFNASFNNLVQRIHTALEKNKNEESPRSQVITRFEGGAVAGKYYQYNQAFDMFFDFFSLREGKISGQGSDSVGHFTIAGNYDSKGKVSFTKQYIGRYAVEYSGHLDCDNVEGFRIQGQWRLEHQTDQFYVESINTSQYDISTKKI